MADVSTPVSGSCLCGRVRLSIVAFDRPVVACHCTQCRKQTGTYVSATRVANDELSVIGEEHLNWYAASTSAERGFCRHCGSLLLWRAHGANATSVMAGCLDSPIGIELDRHIYVEDKGEYYTIDDGLPQFPQSD